MTALEMTKLCAEAMGHKLADPLAFPYKEDTVYCLFGNWSGEAYPYSPLTDDAQALALVKRFKLSLNPHTNTEYCEAVWFGPNDEEQRVEVEGVNRAIVECVAKIRKAGKV